MKLIDALPEARRAASREGAVFEVWLATGFAPLHLTTFLTAELGALLPDRRIFAHEGIYGDLASSIARAAGETAIVLEWSDLDPRLGLRSAGGWGEEFAGSVLASAEDALKRLESLILEKPLVSLALPSLALPPVFAHPRAASPPNALRLHALVAEFAARMAQIPQVRILDAEGLHAASPAVSRASAKADLESGFPYTLLHASALASGLAAALVPAPPLKGLITDLDDTLWAGAAGEQGTDGISWTLDTGAQVHGLYQQLLASLAGNGVLLAAASKNDPAVAAEALRRKDLLLPPGVLFPVEANWGPKPESIQRILDAWNIREADVLFVDDNPLEIEQVRAAFPRMTCEAFPFADPDAVVALLRRLRDRFAKASSLGEDRLRAASLRTRSFAASSEEVLQGLGARLRFDFTAKRTNERAFELVNKTNQFNLNGARYQQADWRGLAGREGDFVVLADYEDRFGPLGRIAAMAGLQRSGRVVIEDWVLSCRAFSRRIEYQCLRRLFEVFGAREIELEFLPTARNGPLREFLAPLCGVLPEHAEALRLTRAGFEAACPALYHEVEDIQ